MAQNGDEFTDILKIVVALAAVGDVLFDIGGVRGGEFIEDIKFERLVVNVLRPGEDLWGWHWVAPEVGYGIIAWVTIGRLYRIWLGLPFWGRDRGYHP